MFSNFITDTGVVVVVLGLMIFVHELGHFLAAKGFGVRVLTFSFGFGKRLFGVKRGDTDYRVSLLPLGGYVKMAGDNPSQPLAGDPGEYLSKPRWQRFFIVVMGPAMNVVMAVLLVTLINHYHFQRLAYEEQPARIGDVEAGSPAAEAGLQAGDLIVRFDGLSDPTWQDLMPKIAMSVNETVPVDIVRDGRRIGLTLRPRPEGSDRVGYIGVEPIGLGVVVNKVEPNSPADRAGIQSGDRVAAIDGKTVSKPEAIVDMLQKGKGKEVDLAILRGGREIHVQVKPVLVAAGNASLWRVGFSLSLFPGEMVTRHLPWGQAFGTSVDFCLENSLLTFEVLRKIVTRQMSTRALTGPIGIAQASGEAYRAGLPTLTLVVAFISLQLGIFNLLPIPILDGGVIVMLLIEGLIRRDLSLEVKERVIQVGFVFLLLLAVFVMYNDLLKTFRPN